MDFAHIDIAKKIVSDLYPDANHVQYVEHGYDNLVVLVDETYALRFPRNQRAYVRGQYEKRILAQLDSVSGVEIPKVLSEHSDPPYFITTFLHGKHLSATDINNLSVAQQEEIGRQIARFIYAMHTKCLVTDVAALRKELGLDLMAEEPWENCFEAALQNKTLPNPTQDALAKKYFLLWKSLTTKSSVVVLHDDLHVDNLLFQDNKLSAVLDFGDTNIGIPEQDFRQLYRINDLILTAAIVLYEQLSGRKLDIEAAKIWAITQELAAYSEELFSNNRSESRFARATGNLNRWLPEGAW